MWVNREELASRTARPLSIRRGKCRARHSVDCREFGSMRGTVGWELRVHPWSIERFDLFARDNFVFVAAFVFNTSADREDASVVLISRVCRAIAV